MSSTPVGKTDRLRGLDHTQPGKPVLVPRFAGADRFLGRAASSSNIDWKPQNSPPHRTRLFESAESIKRSAWPQAVFLLTE